MNERLPEEEVQEYLNQILYTGVKAVLDNAIMPIEERAEQGVSRLQIVREIPRRRRWRLGQQGWPPPMSLTGNKNRRRTQSSIRLPTPEGAM